MADVRDAASLGPAVAGATWLTAMGVTQPDHPLNRLSRNVLLWKALGENSLRFSGLDYTIVRPALRARTFEVTAGGTRGPVDWDRLFAGLKPDRGPPAPPPAVVAPSRCAECAPLAQFPRRDASTWAPRARRRSSRARMRGEFAHFVAETRRDVTGCSNRENDGWVFHPELNWRNPGFAQADEHPVVCVSWNDAQACIAWLNARTVRFVIRGPGLPDARNNNAGFRLAADRS